MTRKLTEQSVQLLHPPMMEAVPTSPVVRGANQQRGQQLLLAMKEPFPGPLQRRESGSAGRAKRLVEQRKAALPGGTKLAKTQTCLLLPREQRRASPVAGVGPTVAVALASCSLQSRENPICWQWRQHSQHRLWHWRGRKRHREGPSSGHGRDTAIALGGASFSGGGYVGLKES